MPLYFMDPLLISVILLSFFITLFTLPVWIRKCKTYGFTSRDVHKLKSKPVANSGGIIVISAAAVGILSYVALQTFYFKNATNLIETFALLCVLLISLIVGLVDDLLGWKQGLSRKIRLIVILFAAIPLMVINAGESTVMGIHFGLFYPLFLIPLGIVAVSTTFNFLAGYNGLESSQGILLLSALGIFTYLTGNAWLSVIAACTVASLIAFYLFNHTPAKVFPGDALTYPIGALIACIVILGNIEKFGAFIFILYVAEVILKSRGKLIKESFANVKDDGMLENRYEKFYGLEHIAVAFLIKFFGKATEKGVVWAINLVQLIVIMIGFIIFL